MTIKKLFRKIHLWLGIASGLVVVILGITGAIYVFEKEMKRFFYHDRVYVSPALERKPASEALMAAQEEVGQEHAIVKMDLPLQDNRSYVFTVFSPNRESQGIWYWDAYGYYRTVYVNPYTAKVIQSDDNTFSFFEIIFSLHWSLLLKQDIGQPIVGISVIVYVFALITGLILWWPKNKKALKQQVWFRWTAKTKWRRKNYEIHKIIGFYSMILALIIALTGLVWAFDWFNHSVQWLANGGKEIKHERMQSDSTNSSTLHPMDALMLNASKKYPDAHGLHVRPPRGKTGTYGVYIDHGSIFQGVSEQYDQYSGRLLATETYEEVSNGEKLSWMNYDIHVGAILGLPGKILAFITSLVIASMPITGFYIWWGRNKKKKKAQKKPSSPMKKRIKISAR